MVAGECRWCPDCVLLRRSPSHRLTGDQSGPAADGAADVDSAELAAGGAVVDGAMGVEDPQATSDTPQSAAPTRIRADRGMRRDPALIILTQFSELGRRSAASTWPNAHRRMRCRFGGRDGRSRGPDWTRKAGRWRPSRTSGRWRTAAAQLRGGGPGPGQVPGRADGLPGVLPGRVIAGLRLSQDERDALIAAEPDRFLLPKPGDLRYNWIVVRLERIDAVQAREIVLDAWQMVVPKRVARAYLGPANG